MPNTKQMAEHMEKLPLFEINNYVYFEITKNNLKYFDHSFKKSYNQLVSEFTNKFICELVNNTPVETAFDIAKEYFMAVLENFLTNFEFCIPEDTNKFNFIIPLLKQKACNYKLQLYESGEIHHQINAKKIYYIPSNNVELFDTNVFFRKAEFFEIIEILFDKSESSSILNIYGGHGQGKSDMINNITKYISCRINLNKLNHNILYINLAKIMDNNYKTMISTIENILVSNFKKISSDKLEMGAHYIDFINLIILIDNFEEYINEKEENNQNFILILQELYNIWTDQKKLKMNYFNTKFVLISTEKYEKVDNKSMNTKYYEFKWKNQHYNSEKFLFSCLKLPNNKFKLRNDTFESKLEILRKHYNSILKTPIQIERFAISKQREIISLIFDKEIINEHYATFKHQNKNVCSANEQKNEKTTAVGSWFSSNAKANKKTNTAFIKAPLKKKEKDKSGFGNIRLSSDSSIHYIENEEKDGDKPVDFSNFNLLGDIYTNMAKIENKKSMTQKFDQKMKKNQSSPTAKLGMKISGPLPAIDENTEISDKKEKTSTLKSFRRTSGEFDIPKDDLTFKKYNSSFITLKEQKDNFQKERSHTSGDIAENIEYALDSENIRNKLDAKESDKDKDLDDDRIITSSKSMGIDDGKKSNLKNEPFRQDFRSPPKAKFKDDGVFIFQDSKDKVNDNKNENKLTINIQFNTQNPFNPIDLSDTDRFKKDNRTDTLIKSKPIFQRIEKSLEKKVDIDENSNAKPIELNKEVKDNIQINKPLEKLIDTIPEQDKIDLGLEKASSEVVKDTSKLINVKSINNNLLNNLNFNQKKPKTQEQLNLDKAKSNNLLNMLNTNFKKK